MKVMTGYSFNHSAGHIQEVMDRIVECGYPVAPISDFCSTFGFVRWRKLAKKTGLRPVYGVTINVTDGLHDKKPATAEVTFYAKEDVATIHELIATATNQFRYTPLLTYDQVNDAQGVVKIIGHRAKLDRIVFDDDTFVALSPAVYAGYLNKARACGAKLIYSSENRYTNAGDRILYETLLGRNANTQSYPQHILSVPEWQQAVAKSGATDEEIELAICNASLAMELCNATLPQGTLLTPRKDKTLRELCVEGAERTKTDLSDPVYAARLDRELALIDDKGFEDYFYIVSEMIAWAKQRMIVGPGRGSSSGSLVCFLLGITMIDPIPYALLFERFIDINRLDLPDIDIDFSSERRDLVFEHAEELYGKDRIARLGTVQMFKPRSVIKDAATSLGVPFWKSNPVLDSLIETSSGDARALKAIEDTFAQTPAGQTLLREHPEMGIAMRMEGHPSNKSQHAAGILITAEPVVKYVATDSKTGGTFCDKKDAEELNLLKIDALGLTQLAIFEDCLEAIGKPREWLDQIPLDDEAAFKVINDRKFSGIFQFEGAALQRVSSETDVRELNDIISLTALARPGPLSSGSTAHWLKRKKGAEPVDIPHPLFEPYLGETFGVVVYQEQIMSIVREVGGLSWEDTSNLRKAMSKSLGREFFDQYGNPFKEECVRKGVPFEVAFALWDGLCAFGAWCFNKSHAVAYGLISYQCAYLKAHYPLEFCAATLSHKKEVADQLVMLRELRREGVNYVPVNAENSTNKWRVATIDGQRTIVGPLQNVVGIGPKIVQEILSARTLNLPLPSRAAKLLASPVTKVDTLSPIEEAFRKVMPNGPAERNIHTMPTPLENVIVTGYDYDVLVFVVMAKINPKDENEDINVAKRGGRKLNGPHLSLGLHLADDTGNVYAKVSRWDYEVLAKPIIDRGRSNKALYCIKGTVPKDFRMINISMVRYIGDVDPKHDEWIRAQREREAATTAESGAANPETPGNFGEYLRSVQSSDGSQASG